MSRGPGRIQRSINAAFDAAPSRRFTTRELAAFAYPGKEVGRSEMVATTRAINKITPALTFCRVPATGRLGWHHVWGRA
ncbi:hypothetical protein ABFT80_23990 [Mesorhizobium sp. SB112]|uniref:hypothetical protein n=1 Tax=Mesorhizobium sp. SB112 TaxID=3151853 RepID=UPI0032673364